MKKIKVGLELSALSSGHSTRGIGAYTRFLKEELEKQPTVSLTLITSQNQLTTEEVDIVHYPFFDFFKNSLPLLSRHQRVITIHDVIPLVFPEHYPAGIKGAVRLTQQKLALKTVGAVITDSEASKKDIVAHLGMPEHKVHVIYLAGNPAVKKSSSSEIQAVRVKYNLPAQFLLYVGDINYNKNIPQLIKALKFLPESVSLVCVGRNFFPQSIPEWLAIDAQVEMAQARDRVQFIASIETSDLVDLSAIYSAALAYIQPSLYEGFGLPVLEAMQCGTPTVVAKNSSLIEVGGDVAMYIDEPTAESIASSVEDILTWSPNKLARWRKAARNWSQQFTWEKTAKNTVAIYKSLMEKQ